MPEVAEAPQTASFSLAEARHIVRDLFEPKPWIYWADFVLSLGAGFVAYAMVRRFPFFSAPQVALFFMAGLLFYRGAVHP